MSTYTHKYNPNRSPDWNYGGSKWKLSRSKIDLFCECPRCFYLNNRLGTARPQGPAFTLNVAVDLLLKREFDAHRKTKTKHPLMEHYGVDAVPFQHKDLEKWRNPFTGITYLDKETGLLVSGAVDDVWEMKDGSLIVVDYKATSKKGKIESLSDSSWEEQYKRQISVYQWLLGKNDFTVFTTGYFVYTNADTDAKSFDNTLHFETTLVPCDGDVGWIPAILGEIKKCLDSSMFPAAGENCEYCPYREISGRKLQALYKESRKT